MRPRRRRFLVVLAGLLLGADVAPLRAQTWAERLGYPPGKRVLILHADDIGMCFEANEAAKRYLSAGDIQSAAAMAPCPWFDEFAAWYREHPDVDVGLHLALTSEWRYYLLFSDPAVREFLRSEGVIFTQWKELMRRHSKLQGALQGKSPGEQAETNSAK